MLGFVGSHEDQFSRVAAQISSKSESSHLIGTIVFTHINKFKELAHEKTKNLGFQPVRHKPGFTATEQG